MKKSLLFLFLTLMMSFTSLFAQSIPNSNFENWDTKSLAPDLTAWQTLNSITSAAVGTASAIKESDASSGKYSVKMVTTNFQGNVIPSYLVYGDLNTQKGHPYTSKPTSFHLSIRSDIPKGDSCSILLALHTTNAFYKGVYAIATGGISGKHSKWTDTTISIAYAPGTSLFQTDSIFVLFSYSNPAKNSFVQLDSFKLLGSGIISQVPNSNFENWDSTTYTDANSWTSFNFIAAAENLTPSVTRSTDAYSGKYAMQVKTETASLVGTKDTFAYATTGGLSVIGVKGGFPAYSVRPSSFSFFYKYTAGAKGDSGNVAVWFSKKGKTLDSVVLILPPQNSYTRYSLTIPLGTAPDTINIAFASFNYYGAHNYSAPAAANGILLVDSLTFGTLNAIDGIASGIQSLNVFPNPSSGTLYLQCYKNDADPLDLTIYNILGQEVLKERLNIGANDNGSHRIESGPLAKGIYTYSIRNSQSLKTGKIIIE